ncbi:MAG: alcohol dehydrogenase catalytic domain-containing protein [Fibrobacter sp.]|nr:alcohol dehydrogenase catalytic domain-containing protein [Fibrobacter sp.]
MIALTYNQTLNLSEIQKPIPAANETLIRVSKAGICNTDIEITKGYMAGFKGVPGHEFIGYADTTGLRGKRVTAEINCGCGNCQMCRSNLQRHCPHRTVIGIDHRDGAFAEYISVPSSNIVMIPDEIPDNTAIFIEPLAAALEITEQILINNNHSVLLIGDGKLAQLIAIVLKYTGCNLLVMGKYEDKLAHLKNFGIDTQLKDSFKPELYDIVIEASGSPQAFISGLSYVKPRGTMVLKSTYAGAFPFNPALAVVNEISIIGSRCGTFSRAIDFLLKYKPDLSYLITKSFPIHQGIEAFAEAQKKGVMKVILDFDND